MFPICGLPMAQMLYLKRAGIEALVESLDKTSTRYKMEISTEKTKLMPKSANRIQLEIKVKWQQLDTVTGFRYLEAVGSDDGSKFFLKDRTSHYTLTKLKPVWRYSNISLESKVKLMRSHILLIFLLASEPWTLTAELEMTTQALRWYASEGCWTFPTRTI